MTLKSSLHAFIALATVASLATACQEDESEQLARSNKAGATDKPCGGRS